MVLSAFVKYWCILLYHKCKVEYIELGMMKIILIIVLIKKIIIVVLKSKMGQQYSWENIVL